MNIVTDELVWLPISEAAQRLKLSDKTVRRRIRDGTLPSQKVIGRYGPSWLVGVPEELSTLTMPTRVDTPREPGLQELALLLHELSDRLEASHERERALAAELAATTARLALQAPANSRRWWQIWRRR